MHKTEPINIPSQSRERLIRPCPSVRSHKQLIVAKKKSRFLSGIARNIAFFKTMNSPHTQIDNLVKYSKPEANET